MAHVAGPNGGVILRTISGWFGVHLMTGLVKEAPDRLQKTLNEEEGADKKLTSIA
jgi:hypothetical protein